MLIGISLPVREMQNDLGMTEAQVEELLADNVLTESPAATRNRTLA